MSYCVIRFVCYIFICIFVYLYICSSSIEIRDDDDEFSNISAKPDSKSDSGNISISEVHLGCTIDQILKAKNHILEGGLLSLMVFPKANTAPSDVYLKKFGGRQQCGLLSPVG